MDWNKRLKSFHEHYNILCHNCLSAPITAFSVSYEIKTLKKRQKEIISLWKMHKNYWQQKKSSLLNDILLRSCILLYATRTEKNKNESKSCIKRNINLITHLWIKIIYWNKALCQEAAKCMPEQKDWEMIKRTKHE